MSVFEHHLGDMLIQELEFYRSLYCYCLFVLRKQLVELRASFNQLVSDYKELLDTFDEYKASQQSQQQVNLAVV